MNVSKSIDSDESFKALIMLIQVIRKDPVINKKVIMLLQLNSFKRRSVLNRWLEELKQRHASAQLLNALPYLFDDKVAEEVLKLIKKNDPIMRK
jgi:hypothetical protein